MNKERLLKIAEHLETGRLVHPNFDFGCINSNTNSILPYEIFEKLKRGWPNCRSNGCAIGEFPVLWPDLFAFGVVSEVVYTIPEPEKPVRAMVKEFLDINDVEFEALFLPDNFIPWNQIKNLNAYATKEEVAQNIRDFIAYRQKEDGVEEINIMVGDSLRC